MADGAEMGSGGLEAEEARLARAAAAGDGEAFATLYERYAQRAYNLALRICGSDEDAADAVQEAFVSVIRRLQNWEAGRELAFGSYLFTATRNATYDLLRRQQRSRPSDAIPESAVPVGAGAGGLGLDPGAPEEDPDRKVLLASQQEQVRDANARLPERQREALALRELEEMSYDEIAAVMEMNRNSVAQLISRARINLRDELRGTALASVASSSPECERALPLIAARDDGQLDPDSEDASWLAAHLASCETCLVATAAMEEAGVSYRAWIPVAIAPWLFKETMARAAELSGADWSEVAERRLAEPTDPARMPGVPGPYRTAAAVERAPRRRRAALATALAVLLLLGGTVAALSAGGGEDPVVAPASSDVADVPVREPAGEPAPEPAEKQRPEPQAKPKPAPTEASAAPAEPQPLPVTEAADPAPAPQPTESKPGKSPAPQPDLDSGQGQGKGKEATEDPAPVREPQPEAVPPPAQEPPLPPPPAPEEPDPTPPRPPTPGGPGDLANPPRPGGPVP